MRRVVFVWLPHWPTDRFFRQRTTAAKGAGQGTAGAPSSPCPPHEAPFGLIRSTTGGLRLMAVNRAAETRGLRAGTLLADAMAQCPELATAPHDAARDKAALHRLSGWCTRFTPWTAPAKGASGEDGLYLDITGVAHLFGGEEGLMRDLLARLGRLGLEARAGLADTPGAAWAVAHFAPLQDGLRIVPAGEQRAHLLGLPVAALRLEDGVVDGLEALGLKTVRDVIDLPRAPLTARLGTSVAHRLDQALGVDEEPISPEEPLVPLRARAHLAEPITLDEHIEQAVAHVARDLCRRLIDQGLGARRLVLMLYRSDGEVITAKAGTAQPCHQAAHMTRLFVGQLEHAKQDFDAGFGIDALAIDVLEAEQSSPGQLAIAQALMASERTAAQARDPAQGTGVPAPRKRKPAARLSADLGHLVDTLGNRLGFEQVYNVVPRDSHVPERALRFEAFAKGRRRDAGVEWRPRQGSGESRPLSLLPAPEPIEVLAEIPEGPPRRFRWRRVLHDVVRFEGPERIGAEWWHVTGQGASADERTRDYFRVEDDAGHRFWLCRHGLYGRESGRPHWYLHGFFG